MTDTALRYANAEELLDAFDAYADAREVYKYRVGAKGLKTDVAGAKFTMDRARVELVRLLVDLQK
jgi:hypothetical protein